MNSNGKEKRDKLSKGNEWQTNAEFAKEEQGE